ncbi:MAG: Tat proofreading chaperone DmsD [Eggerthellaceae bacterium]|jgi:TorA maturation chaperone TorD|nr:Tat proofreading chaperone DmsD [Eggerthellaceae bacterium]MDR2721865.1 Tat proofreading chaperone DmsD [Coriobacteriaceae bacterium]
MEAIINTSRVLGGLYCFDPKEAEGWALISSLADGALLAEWPYGSESELACAWRELQEGIETGRADLAREYQRLFIGPQHFNAPAWGSVYLDRDRVLFGSSTIELRQWIRLNEISVTEVERTPIDHIGKMFMLLGWLAEQKPELMPEYLTEHLMPWVPRYFGLLAADAQNPFYQGVARLSDITLKAICAELEVVPAKKKLYL